MTRPLIQVPLSSAGGEKVDPVTQIAGEDIPNHRLGTFRTPNDVDSIPEVLQNAQNATGNGTAINLKGFTALSLTVVATSGVSAGVVTFEATIDDVTWFPIGLAASDTGTLATSITVGASTTQGYHLSSGAGARSWLRARISTAIVGGTVTVKSRKQA